MESLPTETPETENIENPCAILSAFADCCGTTSGKRNVQKIQVQLRRMGGVSELCKLLQTLQQLAACLDPEGE